MLGGIRPPVSVHARGKDDLAVRDTDSLRYECAVEAPSADRSAGGVELDSGVLELRCAAAFGEPASEVGRRDAWTSPVGGCRRVVS